MGGKNNIDLPKRHTYICN